MALILTFILGTAFGAALIFFILKQSERRALHEQKAFFETRIRDQELHFTERLRDQEMNAHKTKEQFTLLAQEVLTKNMESQVQAMSTQNTHALDLKKQEFNQTFDEIRSHLKVTSSQIQNFEKERVDQYAKITKQIEAISTQEQKLIQETERLKSALTTSQSVRGRWGELVLRNILAQSDLVSGIDFEEQQTVNDTEGNTLKPDFVIKLPQSGQHLVIDSKASIFDSYLESETAQTEAGRLSLHQDFAKRLRTRVTDLSGKEYQKFVNQSLPYVVLFVPSEAAIRAAFDVDPDLFKWAMDRKVFLSSPATILPLIMLIAHGWKQHRLSEKAAELSKIVEQVGDRLETFVKRLSRVQSGLDLATRSWNEAIDKSWNGSQSIQKSLEKARELGGNLTPLTELSPLEHQARALAEEPALLPKDDLGSV